MDLRQLNYKKILIIILFLAVTGLLIYGIIAVFFVNDEAGPAGLPPGPGLEPGGALPGVGRRGPVTPSVGPRVPGTEDRVAGPPLVASGGPTRVLLVNEDLTLDPVPASGGSIAFYDPSEGYFYRQLNEDPGSRTLLTDERFFNVSSVSWAPDQERAVIEYPDGSNILYDFTRRSKVTLPREVTDPVFTQRSGQLVYKTKSSNQDNNWLVVSNADGSNVEFVEPLGDSIDLVRVVTSPEARVVAFLGRPTGVGSSEVLPLGQHSENFKSFQVKGLRFTSRYSPDGRRLLYHVISQQSDFNPSLWITDGRAQTIGQRTFDLGLVTWVDRCVFSSGNRFVYCAVPQNLPAGAGLNEDISRAFPDAFFRVDLDTGFKTRLAIPVDARGQQSFSAIEIWLSEAEDELFFWDFHTGGVYKIRLR